MLLGGSAEGKLHNEIVLELWFPDDVHFSFGFREYGKVGFVVLTAVFGEQPLKILDNRIRVLSELDVELLDFFDSSEIHIIAPELKIKL